MKMDGVYLVFRGVEGNFYLHNNFGLLVATFSEDVGGAAFDAVKDRIAKDGGELYDRSTGRILVGEVGKLWEDKNA